MKYPQLVSTRAVNAISDWLVSRLEQLGVEAPQIYSRLLLSLLQSSVQINDPIEFSNLETFFANEKGSNKRYPSFEPNTLKKINAVQCLREIVSSDQEITPIRLLVDELFEKLIAIEKQSIAIEDGDSSFHHHQHFNKNKKRTRKCGLVKNCGSPSGSGSSASKLGADLENTKSKQRELADSESPKKRYFRAFPALTKEMEDSFGIFKKDAKSLTWPVDKIKTNRSSISHKDGGGCLQKHHPTSENQTTERCSTASVGSAKASRQKHHQILMNEGVNANENMTVSIVKRRTRRRRNQGLSKGRNFRKTACGVESNNRYNNSSPFWDTDFEGCWEMGPDLIKEFMQNNRNNCSASKSAACMSNKERQRKQPTDAQKLTKEHPFAGKSAEEDIRSCSSLIPSVDILFCCHVDDDDDDEDDDTLASVSEIMSASLASTRPLYRRDINDSSQEILSEDINDDHFDFAQFKAKFDSSLEALWSDIPDTTESVNAGKQQNNLHHFWTSYYNHHFDLGKIPQELHTVGDNSEKLFCKSAERDTTNNTSDYYSMPCTLEKSTRFVARDAPVSVFLQNSIWSDSSKERKGAALTSDARECFIKKVWNSPHKINQLVGPLSLKIGDSEMYLQEDAFHLSSQYVIPKWSEGINAGPHSVATTMYTTQPAPEYLHALTNETSSSIISTTSADPKQLPEIDEDSASHLGRHAPNSSVSSSVTSCPSYAYSTNCSWQITKMPQSQNFPADMESWTSSKPNSLNEIYNNSGESKDVVGFKFFAKARDAVTLPNHCAASSGFVEYSRIKLSSAASGKRDHIISKSTIGSQLPQKYPVRTKDCYNAGEDLLNSELTHFRPIKPYEDGHSFYICSALDVVEYERSESGYLYWESEKYLEYIHNDVLAEEDLSAAPTMRLSNASGYALSNYEENFFNSSVERQRDFVMKIRIRNCDAACQTEGTSDCSESGVQRAQPRSTTLSASLQSLTVQAISDSDASKVLNQFVQTTVAKTTPVLCYRSATSCLAIPSHAKNGRSYNDFDVEASDKPSIDLEQWSMYEIRKKCELKNESSGGGGSADMHTLWGMCAACNNEYKSIPANRMLKDELKLEADQIMSDLKYMQDLYIGESAAGDSESELDIGETETESEGIINGGKFFSLSDSTKSSPSGEGIAAGRKTRDESQQQDQKHAAQNVFNKVNRLIADLLWRETCEPIFNTPISKDLQFMGRSSVCSCSEENIWQQSVVDFKPINFLQHLNSGQSNSPFLHNQDDQFLSKLSWEHNYLADIWKKKTPPLTRNSATTPFSPGDDVNCSKYKATNRKRRHSASQNASHTSPTTVLTNNCDELTTDGTPIGDPNQLNYDEMNNNCINREMSSVIRIKNFSSTGPPACRNWHKSTDETANMKQPKQTIITCKYWTTIDPQSSSSAPGFVQGSTFSCLLNKNASILKHVTMITRPLTR